MKITFTSLLFIICFSAHSQMKIQGIVTNENNEALPGANVFLAGTYDGDASDENGFFEFFTNESGSHQLVVTSVGYQRQEFELRLDGGDIQHNIRLKPQIDVIGEVVITAGAFESSDVNKAVVMKPMDIVTTAGATADIAGVMNTLPGTQTVAEDGRLYVRGGSSREVNVFIDGMHVPVAFGPSPQNVPSRFRFSPFLFKGTFFSTGGYSAEYGQALSSVLVLETGDLPQRSQTDISIMSVGADLNQTIRWERSSIYAQLQYTDLGLYFKAVPQKYDYEKAPKGLKAILHYKADINDKGILKIYSNCQQSDLKLLQPYFLDVTQNEWVDLKTDYYYNSISSEYQLSQKVFIKGGVSGTINKEKSIVGEFIKEKADYFFHSKLSFDLNIGDNLFLKAGAESFHSNKDEETFYRETGSASDYHENLIAFYAESDFYLGTKLLLRTGLRYEYSSYLDKDQLAPRLSLAYRISNKSQLSTAYGKFYQLPSEDYLFITNKLDFERASHFIFNYQYKNDGRIFRIESFQKEYNDLLKYEGSSFSGYQSLNNGGDGYARGFDLFWRDEKSIKNADYWVSYSFIDAEKDIQNFPGRFTPKYVSRHNLSIVYKHFVSSIRTQLGWTYHFSSARNYDNPNTEKFIDGKISPYHDLSINASYLLKQNIILHASISNILGLERDFGRQYSAVPDDNGYFSSIEVPQQAKHFIFLGCFITLSKDKSANQLNNL